jgi:hypothetical protein
MAGFNSDQASKKWQSLQNTAGQSLNNIVQGKASTSDFSRVASSLNGLNGLAANVFAQAISAAEVQAKKFEASYAQLQEGVREGIHVDNAANLTAYEKALNAALSTIEPNIVGALKEIIELSNLESNEDLTKTITSGFSTVTESMPQDLPSTHDLLAATELLKEELVEEDKRTWQTRESSLIEKIADVFKSTLRDLAEQISKERRSPAQHHQAQHLALPAPGHQEVLPAIAAHALVPSRQMHDVTDVESHTIVDSAMQMVRPLQTKALTGPRAADTKSAISANSITLSPGAEQAITKAANDQTSLYQKLMDFLAKGDEDSTVDQKEADEDRADTFWNSYKSIVGGTDKKSKKSTDDDGWGWLKTLGSALLLMATNPQLFKTIGDLITKYATWDNLKKVVMEAWDWVGKQAHDVLDWVLDKLHLGGKSDTVSQKDVDASRKEPAAKLTAAKAGHADINNLTPEQKKQMAAMDAANKDHHPNASVASAKPQGTTGNQSIQSAIANKLGITNGAKTVNVEGSTTNQGGTTVNPGESTTTVGGTTVGGNRSTIGGTVNNTSTTNTTSVPAAGASMTPGTSVANGAAGGSAAPAGTGDNRPSKGGPQIGMSTFNFHTGIDDSLVMMNTPYFTG